MEWQKSLKAYERELKHHSTVRKPRHPPSHLIFDGKGSNPHRFMGVIRAPWFNQFNGELERGLSCKGCARDAEKNRRRDCRIFD